MKKASFKEKFFLCLAEELMRNTKSYKRSLIELEVKRFFEHQKELEEKKEKTKTSGFVSIVKEKLEKEKARIVELKKEEKPFRILFEKRVPRLKIPELTLPKTFQYLKPIPLNLPYEINFKKINPLVKDPLVKTIECFGPDSEIIVEGKFGRKRTQIKLTKEEINEIIQIFSAETKIPIIEGLYKVVLGNLELAAIISQVTKFRIRKLSPIDKVAQPFYR
jgi:hypothetical protein